MAADAAAAAAAAVGADEDAHALSRVIALPERVFVRPMRGRHLPEDSAFDEKVSSVLNVCSNGPEGMRETLSPFFLGPVELPFSFVLGSTSARETAKNMENAWQYSKVYTKHVDPTTGEPTPEWYAWARAGFANARAVRFPMGRGAKPEYSFGGFDADNKVIRLGYVEARFRIYAPLYARLVDQNPTGFNLIKREYNAKGAVTLLDFDGWDNVRRGLSLRQVMYNPNHKCGHGFVLAMMLAGKRVWDEPFGGDAAITDALQAETPLRPSKRLASVAMAETDGAGAAAAGAAVPSPAKMYRIPQPAPVPGVAEVPSAFQEWAERQGFASAKALSVERAAFGFDKYKTTLMTQNGRDPVEDAKDEVGDFFHYAHQAFMENQDVSSLGPHLRAAMVTYFSACASRSGLAAPSAAYLSEGPQDLELLGKEADHYQAILEGLRNRALDECKKDGWSLAPMGGVYLPKHTCYKPGCGDQASSTETKTAPAAVGRGQMLIRFLCSACTTA